MGKSEFLEQDLMPAARAARYSTAYLNLWDAKSHPAPSLLAALTRALEPKGLSKLAHTFKRPIKSVKASAKVAGVAEASLQAELEGGTHATVIPRLTELIRDFDKPNRRMLPSGCETESWRPNSSREAHDTLSRHTDTV